MLNLKNKKIIIFGASGLIGSQTAVILSKLGAKLILNGRDKDKLVKLASSLEGDLHEVAEFDICKLDEIEKFMHDIINTTKEKLYGMVYCAGIIPVRPMKNTTHEFLYNTMLINYLSFAEIVRCFSHRKVCNGGSIVAISSYASQNGDKGQLAYSASKGAMDSSIVVMAKELMSKNIRVNAIRPAIVANKDLDRDVLSQRELEIIERMQTDPIDPKNIAEQTAFLLDGSSSAVTGRCFDVRGYLS